MRFIRKTFPSFAWQTWWDFQH